MQRLTADRVVPPPPSITDQANEDQPDGGVGDLPAGGQAFADLLLLAALAAQAPVVLLSVPRPGGAWSTLSHGCEHRHGLNDPALFDAVARRSEPVEFADMGSHPDLARSPLCQAPHNLRWAYGTALHDGGGVIGVVVLLDRWLRQGGKREARTLRAVERQLSGHLAGRRRVGVWKPDPDPAPAATTPRPMVGRARRPARTSVPLPLADGQQLLRSHEVAVLFDVTERTVINWAAARRLPSLRTMGGHLRFRSDDVFGLIADQGGT